MVDQNSPMNSDDVLDFNKKRHASARLMAWTALIFVLIFILVILFKIPPEYMANYDGMFMYLFGFAGAIVLGYLGFTTWGTNEFLKQGNITINGTNTGANTYNSNSSANVNRIPPAPPPNNSVG